jgi:GT2 family glycosyltransferase|tara:strand:- start:164 stop:1168 length:1005 start_codon:yes stop_codon:yes gene_type:complete
MLNKSDLSKQNLSVVMVTLKSEHVIHKCIKSIDKDIPIIVVENSDNFKFKEDIEKKYPNVNCLLSHKNLGMGSGSNLGIEQTKTDYVLILNPDVTLEDDTIDQLILASKNISDFTILSPISIDDIYPNYQFEDQLVFPKILATMGEKKTGTRQAAEFAYMKIRANNQTNLPFNVKSVDGYAMLLNKKKFNTIMEDKIGHNLEEKNYFDENFFMYCENDDLCRRIIHNGGNIFVVPNAKIHHLGAKSVNDKYEKEVEFSRNWHWIWSKFYFHKKHFGFLEALLDGCPKFFLSIIKCLFYLLINNKKKKNIYFNRASGFYNALVGNSSWYRPKIND